jgi:hypothetical protein
VHLRGVLGIYFIVRGGDPQLGWKYLEGSLEDSEIIQDVDLLVPIGGNWSLVAPEIIRE